MNLFLSSFTNKIDQKGRVSVPSSFRIAVAGEQFAGVVLFRSFTGKCIDGMPMSRMEKIADAADNGDIFDSKIDEMAALVFADARQLQFDITGRIVLPPDLMQHAGITDSALFVGRGKSFQIWEPGEFAKIQSQSLEKLKTERPSLVIK